MSYDALGQGGLDYLSCRYGKSKIMFRGPRRDLSKPYVAFFGGTETYGKFIAQPYPALIEPALGLQCVNLGCGNAGIEAFAADPHLTEVGVGARVSVIQVMGAQNMSNRFYAVHPRRNDRFVKASQLMATIFRDVDFAEFNFTKHMLMHLQSLSPERFAALRDELQEAWLARMRVMLQRMRGKTVLLWFSAAAPDTDTYALGLDPWFVMRPMLDALRSETTEIVEVTVSPTALAAGTSGMVFTEMERPAAQAVLGPAAHHEAADALLPVLQKLA